jgi:hypothetical protein
MKPIRILSLASVLLLGLGVMAAPSQPGGSSQGRGSQATALENHLRLLAVRLRLSENQESSIRSIFVDQLAQENAIGKDESLSQAEKISKVRILREASASKVRELLDDGQRQTFDEMQLEHIGYGHGQGYGRGTGQGSGHGRGCQMPSAADHLQILTDRLKLSQDQQARLTVVIEDALAQMEAIRKDASLSPDGRMIKARMLREATASRARDELTEVQRKRFDEMGQDKEQVMKQRRERGEDCAMIWLVVE